MSIPETSVITRYFEADARRDSDAIVALFTDEAVVIDEGQTYHGTAQIRGWQEGAASQYQYTTEVFGTERTDEESYLVTGLCWLLGISVRKKHKRCEFNCSSEVYFLLPPRDILFAFHVIAAFRCIFLNSPVSKISADSRPFSTFMLLCGHLTPCRTFVHNRTDDLYQRSK